MPLQNPGQVKLKKQGKKPVSPGMPKATTAGKYGPHALKQGTLATGGGSRGEKGKKPWVPM